MDIDEMIEVLQAYRDGKVIENKLCCNTNANWGVCGIPIWDFNRFDYRVKPEPKRILAWTEAHELALARPVRKWVSADNFKPCGSHTEEYVQLTDEVKKALEDAGL